MTCRDGKACMGKFKELEKRKELWAHRAADGGLERIAEISKRSNESRRRKRRSK